MRHLKPNTVIRLPDGRIGTITYHFIDGYGGVWGEKEFTMEELFENPPEPEFMLREKEIEEGLREFHKNPNLECVGTEFEVLREGSFDDKEEEGQ